MRGNIGIMYYRDNNIGLVEKKMETTMWVILIIMGPF